MRNYYSIIYSVFFLIFCFYVESGQAMSVDSCPAPETLIITPLPAKIIAPGEKPSIRQYQWIGFTENSYQLKSNSYPLTSAPTTDKPSQLKQLIISPVSSSGYSWYMMCVYHDASDEYGGYIVGILSGRCRLNRTDYTQDPYTMFCLPNLGVCNVECQ